MATVRKKLLTPPGYTFMKIWRYAVFYHLETNVLNVPEVTDYVQVDRDLHVKLFYKSLPVPLPQWFRQGRDCRLMMENFPNYIKLEGEQTFSILEELKEHKFKKKRIFSSNVIQYSLLLHYTSSHSYWLLMSVRKFDEMYL